MERKYIGIDSETEAIMDFLDSHYKVDFTLSSIGRMKAETLRHCPVPSVDKYDKYNVLEFFTLYKLDKMVALGNISREAADLLKNLIDFRKKISSKVGKYDYDKFMKEDESPDTEEISVLRDRLEEIDEILESYGLTLDEPKLDEVITSVVLAEGEYDPDMEELESTVKTLGTLKID
jgi:hypothetical protein